MNDNNGTLEEYILIDWNQPPPVITPKPIKMTVYEKTNKNRAFALNQTTKRYIERNKYHEYSNLFKR